MIIVGIIGDTLLKLRLLLDSIRFEHTIFALPFAYLGMVLAADGLPTSQQFIWVTVAMGSARTLAMSANRIIDRYVDALNPRTSSRHLPSGRVKLNEMAAMTLVSLAIFLVAAYQLNILCFVQDRFRAITVSYTHLTLPTILLV